MERAQHEQSLIFHLSSLQSTFISCYSFKVEENINRLVFIVTHLTASLHSALLGFLLLLATVRLKSGFSLEHFGIWIFMSKVIIYQIFTRLNSI